MPRNFLSNARIWPFRMLITFVFQHIFFLEFCPQSQLSYLKSIHPFRAGCLALSVGPEQLYWAPSLTACAFWGFSLWLVAVGTLSSPSWGVVLSSPFRQLPPQPVGPLLVCSHSFAEHTELNTARRPSEDSQSSLSACLCSSVSSRSPSHGLRLRCPFWIPSSISSAWSLDYTWLPVPYSAALNLASEPGSERGQSWRSCLSFPSVRDCCPFLPNFQCFKIIF